MHMSIRYRLFLLYFFFLYDKINNQLKKLWKVSNFAVCGGALAVSCNHQSAIDGPINHIEDTTCEASPE